LEISIILKVITATRSSNFNIINNNIKIIQIIIIYYYLYNFTGLKNVYFYPTILPVNFVCLSVIIWKKITSFSFVLFKFVWSELWSPTTIGQNLITCCWAEHIHINVKCVTVYEFGQFFYQTHLWSTLNRLWFSYTILI